MESKGLPPDWMFRVQFFYYYLVWTSGLLPHKESQPEPFILVGRLLPSQKSWPEPFILSNWALLYAKGAVSYYLIFPQGWPKLYILAGTTLTHIDWSLLPTRGLLTGCRIRTLFWTLCLTGTQAETLPPLWTTLTQLRGLYLVIGWPGVVNRSLRSGTWLLACHPCSGAMLITLYRSYF